MVQRLQNLPLPLRVLVYAATAAVVLAVAVGGGAMIALVLGPNSGLPEEVEQAGSKAGEEQQNTSEESAPGRTSKVEYLSQVENIQNGSVEASLESNDNLLRYDNLTSADVESMRANRAALKDYSSSIKNLDPPEEYEEQYGIFVLAIGELHDANRQAYRLVAKPTSATQADFEAYDAHLNRATLQLQRSNQILGRRYKTTEVAEEVAVDLG